ncbi:MAG TPA: hypothetical protein VGF21_14880 [Thermoleophilaceae bacterium]
MLAALLAPPALAARPKLSHLKATISASGKSVLVTGRVRHATSVRTAYRGNCGSRRLRGRHSFRIRLRRAAKRHARRCRTTRKRVLVRACRRHRCVRRKVRVRHRPAAVAPFPQLPKLPTPRVFLSPLGNDLGPCTRALPCRSFDRGYRQAAPGYPVEVAGGAYPEQTIRHDPAKTSPADVYLVPARGAHVVVQGNIRDYGSHIAFYGMSANDTDVPYDGPVPVDDVTFAGMNGRNFTIDSATNVRVLGGDYGPASDCGGPYGGSNNGIRKNAPTMPSNILIDGVNFHDIQSYDLDACHIECLIVGAGRNITVRNSRFRNCSIFDIFFQPFNGDISNVTLENNWFAAPTDPAGRVNSSRAVEFSGGGPWRNVLIRHNSINTHINLNDGAPGPSYSGVRVIGNLAKDPGGCYGGVVYRANVFQNGTCNSTDRSLNGGAMPFRRAIDGPGFDYHLTGGAAVDRVSAAYSNLGDDIDRQRRPRGKARDAGSDELR